MVTLDRKTGRGKVYHHRMRLYSKTEIVAMMKRCGLEDVRVFGDFDGNSFSKFASSHPIIYLGRKP